MPKMIQENLLLCGNSGSTAHLRKDVQSPLMQYFCHEEDSWYFSATKNIMENIKSYDSA